jgi:hypothetical protein
MSNRKNRQRRTNSVETAHCNLRAPGVPEQETAKHVYEDVAKWNQIVFEQANRNHLHQDSVRWTLFAGFALFFLTSMQAINNPQNNHLTFHKLQFVVVALGTLYFVVLMIEGWYYNLYLAHVLDCESRIAQGKLLVPTASLDRSRVWPVHPSFIFLLSFVVIANSAHLWEALSETLGNWKSAIVWSGAYALSLLAAAIFAPRWLATWLP